MDSRAGNSLRTSCDACKYRKVKCDRRARVEKYGIADDPRDGSIICSVCEAHNLQCTFSNIRPEKNKSAIKRRAGKRIAAIRNEQGGDSNDIDDTLASRSQIAEQQGIDPTAPLFGSDIVRHEGTELYDKQWYTQNNVKMRMAASTSTNIPQSLLGVQGLTRPLLDACVKSFFKDVAPSLAILHAEVFAARYALYFSISDEDRAKASSGWKANTAPRDPNYDPDSIDRPMSELLLLAVGSIGAAFLEPPITEAGSKSKFRLQDKLALRFEEEIDSIDLLRRLDHEGLDVVEACYIMSDPNVTIMGPNPPSRSPIHWDAIDTPGPSQLGPPQRHLMRLRPASHEGVIRLLYQTGINLMPKIRKDCPANDTRTWQFQGRFFTVKQVYRRMRIFWSIFIRESYIAINERRATYIGEDDYDLDRPKFIPRPDNNFTAIYFDLQNEEQQDVAAIQSSHLPTIQYDRFDALHLQVLLRLTFITRNMSSKLVSPRSQGRGILLADAERAINAMVAWYEQLPNEVKWEAQIELASAGDSQGADANRRSLKAFVLEVLFHINLLTTWSSVDLYGIRKGTVQSDVSDAIVSSEIPTSASLLVHEEEIEEKVRLRLDELTRKSFFRVSILAKGAAKLNLIRAHRYNAFSLSAFAIWGCCLVRKVAMASLKVSEGNDADLTLAADLSAGINGRDSFFNCVDELIGALETIDTLEHLSKQVRGLKAFLKTTKQMCQTDPTLRGRRVSMNNGRNDQVSSDDGAVFEPYRHFFKTRGRGDLRHAFVSEADVNGKAHAVNITSLQATSVSPIQSDHTQESFGNLEVSESTILMDGINFIMNQDPNWLRQYLQEVEFAPDEFTNMAVNLSAQAPTFQVDHPSSSISDTTDLYTASGVGITPTPSTHEQHHPTLFDSSLDIDFNGQWDFSILNSDAQLWAASLG